jgi:hypothetical protein
MEDVPPLPGSFSQDAKKMLIINGTDLSISLYAIAEMNYLY